jgi:hypothetical protein
MMARSAADCWQVFVIVKGECMACWDGFGDLSDGRPFWTGNFTGSGRTEILFYYPGDQNWWLGQFNGTSMTWHFAGNTTGFGQVWDGRPVWTGNFTGSGRTEILFYYPGDQNWWLGQFNGTAMTWHFAGNTTGFGQVWDGRPFWFDTFTGSGRTEILFYYPGDQNWWLGQFTGTTLAWHFAGNTSGFGDVGDGRPVWARNFSRPSQADILFYYPGDQNWWLGQFNGTSVTWHFAGNTSGFGQVWDGRPFWLENFTGSGRTEILFYYPGDQNWWLGQVNGTAMTWHFAGNTTGFGNVGDGRPIWAHNFSRPSQADILFYFPGDQNWWLGQFNGTAMTWHFAGNTTGFGQVWDGRPFWFDRFTGAGRTEVLFYFPGDQNWWLGQFTGTAMSWHFAGNTTGFGQVWDGRPFWTGNFTGAGQIDLLFYYPGDGNWWLGQFNGTAITWHFAGHTGRPYNHRVRLLLKTLVAPTVNIDTMLASMRQVFAAASIMVEEGPRENLTIMTPGGTPQLDFNVGQCRTGQMTTDQTQLFQNRNNAGANDMVIYFVRATIPPFNGCAAHPAGRPGAIVAQGASRWTMAHEVCHVLGLDHIPGENTGCPPATPECCSTPDFTRLMTGCGTGNITGTPVVTNAEITSMHNSALTIDCP